jgi:hypothetical protein
LETPMILQKFSGRAESTVHVSAGQAFPALHAMFRENCTGKRGVQPT